MQDVESGGISLDKDGNLHTQEGDDNDMAMIASAWKGPTIHGVQDVRGYVH